MITDFAYIFFYNILQLSALLLLWPFLALLALKGKYRSRIGSRLGFGLAKLTKRKEGPRIWVHALSVGEAASSLPLLTVIRRDIPEAEIIFSTTTKGGRQYAEGMGDVIDQIVPFPFDIYWVTKKFINHLTPDLFILIETDFWPNILWQMKDRGIPTLLANGRITLNSFNNYKKAGFLFGPLFNSFNFISMQVETDAMRMINLGVFAEKVVYCGNLKYDMEPFQKGRVTEAARREDFNLPEKALILVAGSTHKGEEEIIIDTFISLKEKHNLALIIAPRDIQRSAEIATLIQQKKLTCNLRSRESSGQKSIMVLDTLGELARVYTLADLAFVGGSLVPEGGHNPIEPAILGKAVIFGAHMEDFAEISQSLLQNKGALQVTKANITPYCDKLLAYESQRRKLGDEAARVVNANQGAANRYIKIIKKIIGNAQK